MARRKRKKIDTMQVTETLAEGLKHEFKISVPASDLDAKADAKLVDLKDKVLQNSSGKRSFSAWCGRRDSNPHNFRHWNLNPARLPIPPRPLLASCPAAMPSMIAEKCEAVFRAANHAPS